MQWLIWLNRRPVELRRGPPSRRGHADARQPAPSSSGASRSRWCTR